MEQKKLISMSNSLMLRGGGIFLMLIHHLFYSESSRLLYDDLIFHGHGLVNEIGVFCKVCVAIFVFVSGYGLSYKYKEGFDKKNYYKSRFKKLYFNYWFIWLLFVPTSVFVYHRSFEDVYGTHIILKSGLDILGVLNLTGQFGYNATWWFYSCIIVLYLIYPWLAVRFDKSPYLILTLSVFTIFASFIPFVQPWGCYLLPFLAGMMIERKPQLIEKVGKWECIIALTMLCLMRNFCGNLWFIVDTLICVGLAIFFYRIRVAKWFEVVMCNLGKHSMNIFLFHTFIYLYWFEEYIYITRNPLLLFFSLLFSTYLISVIVEYIKEGLIKVLKIKFI